MRRLLLVLALVLALLTVGCVQITNPQFDARYRYHAEPIVTATYAVFALWTSPGLAGAAAPVRLVIVDVAKRSVVASMSLGTVRVLSDLGSGASGGDTTMLAAKDAGFEEIDVAKRTVRPVTTSILTTPSMPAGVAYDRGVRLLWSERDRAVDIARRPSNEQTATLDLRRSLKQQLPGVTAEMGPLWYAGSSSTQDAFFVSRRSLSATTAVAVPWRADFLTHVVSRVGTPTPWPIALKPTPEMHVERVIRRWGAPSADASGNVRFVSPPDLETRAVMPPVPTVPFQPSAPRVLFEPGGERYFTVEAGVAVRGIDAFATRITERSLARPAYARAMPVPARHVFPARDITPLGVIGDTYAYGLRSVVSRDIGVPDEYDLVFSDLKSGKQTTIVDVRTAPSMRLDYLGSYTR